VHNPAKIVLDLAVTLAPGGECMADIAVLRTEPGRLRLGGVDQTVTRAIGAGGVCSCRGSQLGADGRQEQVACRSSPSYSTTRLGVVDPHRRDEGTVTEIPASGGRPLPEIDTTVPHSARVWNYWLGGKDNYEVDRAAGDAVARTFPGISTLARQGRRFLIRSVRYLVTEAGIRQFLDIGTGLPTMDNTHQVAQRAAPECRIVYVDNDPLVLAHARALLVNTTPQGATAYVDCDFHEPDQVVADAKNILNFNEPIGVMFMGVLGHVADYEESRSIVARIMAALSSGSYLTLWDGTNVTEDIVASTEDYSASGAVTYSVRAVEEIAGYFEGMELVDPGVVPVSLWRPDSAEVGAAEPVSGHGAVGRKP
jgi:hypothetical protein